MKFASAALEKHSSKVELLFAPSYRDPFYYRWKDYVNLSASPTIKGIEDFHGLLKNSKEAMRALKAEANLFSKLEKLDIKAESLVLPFVPLLFRDFYCFEEHVSNARKGRNLEMLPEWYEAPVFYYSNPLSFRGPFDKMPYPKDSKALDFELEIAAVIGNEIRNADAAQAKEAIFGYAVLNDWTARDFQTWEMKMNMGPTKGKDFCTTFGSFVVTADEIESKRKAKGFDIEFELKLNGESLTKKNWSGIQFSFEEMLVRGSKNCTIYPGEVIASGTMGKGCLMEHNLGKEIKVWLKPGDIVEMNWLPDGPVLKNKIGEPE